jgi:hypothetical protein
MTEELSLRNVNIGALRLNLCRDYNRVMEEQTDKTKGTTRGLRWQWEKLAKAATKEELEQLLAEATTMVGEDDVEIRGSVPGKGYVKLMGDAYLA